MPDAPPPAVVDLPTEAPIWDRFLTVAPLVLVGTREEDGSTDLAPKHLAMPFGWRNRFCFVCSPRHATQHNAQRTGVFTVSFPRPQQFLQVSMAAGARAADATKPTLAALRTRPASRVDGVLVCDASAWLECELERVIEIDELNTLFVGDVVAAAVDERALRDSELDDEDVLAASPVLAYLYPSRFAAIEHSMSFPFPAGYRR